MNYKSLVVASALLAGVFASSAARADDTTDIQTALGLVSKVFVGWTTTITSLPEFTTTLASVSATYGTSTIKTALGGHDDLVIMHFSSTPWVAALGLAGTDPTLNGGIVNTSTQVVQNVPGPEAGAGVGALAMGGVAYLIHRRRKAATAA